MVQWSGWASFACAHHWRRRGATPPAAPPDRAQAKPSVIPVPAALPFAECDRRISGTGAALSAIRHGRLRSMSRAAVNIDRTLDPNQMPAKGGVMKIALSIMALATSAAKQQKRGTADWFVS
jgi:hypothetical protein